MVSNWLVTSLALLAAVPSALAQTPAAPPAAAVPEAATANKPQKSQWVFSILPKSFQKNPLIDLTVITEKSVAGKKLPPVSPAAPAYFIAQSSGFRPLGESPGNERTLKPEDVELLLTRSLATNGYLPATPEHPPSLAVFYTWGSHSLLVEPDEENPVYSADQIVRNLLDRAALVGGVKFSQEMLKLFEQADTLAMSANVPPPPGAEGPVITPEMLAFTNPIEMFKRADPKNDFLVEQFTNNIYYVVASAYDYASLNQRTRLLLWRTRMTVAAQGVSQDQTLPTLIVAAAPFFGKDMSEPELITKKATPEGSVEIGTATVVEMPAIETKKPAPAKPR